MQPGPEFLERVDRIPEIVRHLTRRGDPATPEQLCVITHIPTELIDLALKTCLIRGDIVPTEGGFRLRAPDEPRFNIGGDPKKQSFAWGYRCTDYRRMMDFAADLEDAGCNIIEVYGASRIPGVVGFALAHPSLDADELEALVRQLDDDSQTGPALGRRSSYFSG